MTEKKKPLYMVEGLYQTDCLPSEPISDSWLFEAQNHDVHFIHRCEERLHKRGIRSRRTVLEL